MPTAKASYPSKRWVRRVCKQCGLWRERKMPSIILSEEVGICTRDQVLRPGQQRACKHFERKAAIWSDWAPM